MHTLLQDIRFTLRQLRNSPGFTVTAVLTLAVGIGATTAIFSLIHQALRLPFPQPNRLVTTKNTYPGVSYTYASYPDFEVWKEQNQAFAQLAAASIGIQSYTSAHEPVSVKVSAVSNGFFPLFGLKPIQGHAFSSSNEQKGAAPVCVLSENFWKQEFGGSRAILGRAIVLNGRSYAVIGVVPDMVPSLLLKTQVWLPLEASPPWDQHGTNYLLVTGLLKPGISIKQAQSDLAVIQRQIDKQFPDNRHGIEVEPLAKFLFGDIRPVMLILLAAVGFILLIACVNLANMMLARATDRMREFGIRQALGATPARLMRQSLTESGCLALIGGALGLAIAFASMRMPLHAWPQYLEAPQDLHLDGGVLLFSAALVIVTCLIFGLLPAIQILRRSAKTAVQQDLRTMSESREQRLMRSGLMVAEIALATLLVGGALGTALYFSQLLHTDPGVDPDHVLSMWVELPPNRYAKGADQQRFFHLLRQRLDSIPGVESAGGISAPPFSGGVQSTDYTYEGEPPTDLSQKAFTDDHYVTPGYFRTMRIPLLRGRWFSEEDTNSSLQLIVNRSLAAKLWPHQNALGKWIHLEGASHQLIGIVGDVRGEGVAQPVHDQVYLTTEQYPDSALDMVIRTKGDPLGFAGAARRAVHGIDAQVLAADVAPVETLAAESVAGQSAATALMSILGLLALLLAGIGVYGVIAYSVSRREREFGIRIALGAQRGQIISLLLRSTGWVVLSGMGIGVLLAVPLDAWMRNLLGEVEGFPPAAFAVTALLLGLVAVVATLIPARHAASIDPMQSLRTD